MECRKILKLWQMLSKDISFIPRIIRMNKGHPVINRSYLVFPQNKLIVFIKIFIFERLLSYPVVIQYLL